MSAIVTSDSMALVFLPIALVAQMVLSGAFLAVESILLTPLAWLTPAFWTFSALASSNDLRSLERGCSPGTPSGAGQVCGNFWGHEIGDLRLSLLALLAFTFLFLGLAAWALHRKDPVRTLR